ncbi:MAG: Ig-like domain-containing protein, partial [Myxococcaceae bacterium]
DTTDTDCVGTTTLPSTDCQDPTCNTRPCNAYGGICSFATKACVCPSGVGAETGLCGDGLDNDCDGKIDCADPDCQLAPGGSCGTGNGFRCSTASTCLCSGNGGAPQATETTCNDGHDNDCDGLSDCADPGCRPVGNTLGLVCDATGNTCSNPVAGVSSCNVCSGNGGQVQSAEFSCGDTKDNDCDGLIDCLDPNCGALACTSTGKRCVAATSTCECPGPESLGETTCGDGLDNDCDGQADCTDQNCQPISGNPAGVCSTTGKFCTTTGTCQCSGNGGTAEVTEGLTAGARTCGDGRDNDCDGVSDCADPNCRPVPPTVPGKDCSQPAGTPATIGKICDITSQCICPGGQAAEVSCADGSDNDCDGLVDCADPSCLSQTCSSTGRTCSSTSVSGCTCPSGLTAEVTCSNNTDDDCDGLIDCVDGDCATKVCNATDSNYKCTTTTPSICQDVTSTYSLVVTSARARVPADGIATTLITALLKNGTTPVTGASVSFAVSNGTGTVSPASAPTDATGRASVTFTSAVAGGVSTITATYNLVNGSVNVDQPRVGQVKFVSQQYSVMGVRYSSFQETNDITFQVLDTASGTYPQGLTVNFSHSPVGTSFLGSLPACTLTNCTATGVTDATGFVKVALHSGTVASVVSVQAVADAGGGSANATASNIAIVGAKASGNRVSLDCTPKNVPALTNHDCTNSYFNANINCRAAFADRFNNVLGVPTLATFSTEAGAAGPPAQVTAGVANGYVAVNGYSLPLDVPASLTGEYALTFNSGCGVKEHNPRDGLVSIIVSAIGEEGFIDGSNSRPANGIYDLGENFMDQGEPFVDANDNGLRDANEPYVDANNNSQWNGPNGSWDPNTVVWAETRVVYTGFAARYTPAPPADEISRWYTMGPPVPPWGGPTSPPVFSIPTAVTGPPAVPAGSADYRVYFADQNFNQPASQTTYSLTVVSGTVTAVYTTMPGAPVDNLGLSFTQQFCAAPPPAASSCASSCLTSPCYIVGTVGGFSHGTYGAARITAGAAGTVGAAEVRANSTLNGVTVPLSIRGSTY